MEPKYVGPSVDLKDVKTLFVENDDQITKHQDQLAIVNRRIAELEEERSSLFDIEADRIQQIEDELGHPEKFTIDMNNLGSMQLYARRKYLEDIINFLGSGYNTWMPLDPLNWRNEETGLPVFALFSITSATVIFNVNPHWFNIGSSFERCNRELVGPKYYPNTIQKKYVDIAEASALEEHILSAKKHREKVKLGISAKFTGKMPDHARNSINVAIASKFFLSQRYSGGSSIPLYTGDLKDVKIDKHQHIFLLTDVEKWNISVSYPKPVPVRVDPIVVGWTPFYPDRFWYIDSFDITPIENLVPFTFS